MWREQEERVIAESEQKNPAYVEGRQGKLGDAAVGKGRAQRPICRIVELQGELRHWMQRGGKPAANELTSKWLCTCYQVPSSAIVPRGAHDGSADKGRHRISN